MQQDRVDRLLRLPVHQWRVLCTSLFCRNKHDLSNAKQTVRIDVQLGGNESAAR